MRCYNGCPDSALQAALDARAQAHQQLAKAVPGARCVWFPSPGFWQVFSRDHRELSGEHGTVEEACYEAMKRHGPQ